MEEQEALVDKMRIQATIPVEPVGKARPQTWRTKGGKVVTYTPDKTRYTEMLIRSALLGQKAYFGAGIPIKIVATFYRQRPKSTPKKVKLPARRPDFDNEMKTLTDACEKFLYADDGQITTAIIRKRFAAEGEIPRIEIVIEEDK